MVKLKSFKVKRRNMGMLSAIQVSPVTLILSGDENHRKT